VSPGGSELRGEIRRELETSNRLLNSLPRRVDRALTLAQPLWYLLSSASSCRNFRRQRMDSKSETTA
jgi:hypothetical protein